MKQPLQDDRLTDLRYWMALLSRQRWLVLGCALGVSGLAAAFSFRQENVYQATCMLYLNVRKVQPLSFDDIYSEKPGRAGDPLVAQIEIIRSRPILELAVRDLEEQGKLGFEGSPDDPTDTPDSRRAEFLTTLKDALRVETVRGNAFLTLTIRATSPQLAESLSNAVASAYLKNDRERLRKGAEEAIAWLSAKVREQKDKVLAAERTLQGSRTKPRQAGSEISSVVDQEVKGLQEALLGVRLRLLEVEAGRRIGPTAVVEDTGKGGEEGTLQADVERALREKVRQDLVATSVALRQLRQRYGDRHPDVVAAVEREKQLADELARLGPAPLGAVRETVYRPASPEQIEVLRAQERMLQERLAQSIRVSVSREQEGARHEILRREVELTRALYNEMLSRLNQITISAGLDAATAEIFEPARAPSKPVAPDHRRNILLGLLVGLILGVGSAAVRDHLDQSVRDPEHANDLLKAPVLGLIPHHGRLLNGASGSSGALLVGADGESACAEAYRVLCSHIEGALLQEDAGLLLLTSAVPGEGKSTTAANVAAAFAESGRRILLIDGDLRRPSLSRYFALDPRPRLSNVLRKESTPAQEVQATPMPNLDVLLGYREGEALPDASQLTQSYRELFAWAREHYDHVIVDGPVVMTVPGVTEVARAGASVVLVHRPGWVPSRVLELVREHLLLSKARLVGVVLNAVRARWSAGSYPLLPYYSSGPSSAFDGKRGRRLS